MTIVNQLLTEGVGPTATLVTNVLWRVMQQPTNWQHLAQDPDFTQKLIDESLRFDPPKLAIFRTATEDCNDYGTKIPKDARVMLHLGAANRDPRIFENPNRFIANRAAIRNVAFGLGTHFCIGAQLSRAIAATAIESVHRHCPGLNLGGPGKRTEAFYQWGRSRLPVTTKTSAVPLRAG